MTDDKNCAQCLHRDLHRVPGTDACGKLVRVMFNTPLSCWEGRQPGMPCGPDALLFSPEAHMDSDDLIEAFTRSHTRYWRWSSYAIAAMGSAFVVWLIWTVLTLT